MLRPVFGAFALHILTLILIQSAVPTAAHSASLRWVEKAARTLRGGQGLAASEDRAAWQRLTPEQAVNRLMADPRFGDTLLDFNLFVLGAKPNRLRRSDGSLDFDVFGYPQAIAAAQATLRGGDFFELFDKEVPLLVPSFRNPFPRLPEDKDIPGPQLRQRMMARIQAEMDQMIQWSDQHPRAKPREALSLFANHFNNGDWFYLGVPREIVLQIVKTKGWWGDVYRAGTAGQEVLDRLDLGKTLRRIKEINARFFAQFDGWMKPNYDPRSVADLKSLDLEKLGANPRVSFFSYLLALRILNSSTNYDRKRGAWALSRFFCDDLTPLPVAAPSEHSRGRHASDPACRACHHRLEPMAGFFRNFGVAFNDHSDSSLITFDDLVAVDRAKYEQDWADPTGKRAWNVGYIRSTTDPLLNDYGSSIDDFFSLLRRAPEVKQCLVRRMFEYVVGENQSYDGAYLESLTQDFSAQVARGDSAGAVKATFAKLVLSRAFAEPDPPLDRCYDQPSPNENAPPCRVAYLLQKNCATCHGSPSPSSGLNLTQWIPLSNGTYSFPHRAPDGRQRDKADTFRRLIDRLSTSDPDRAMPLGQYISADDRARLYLWAIEGATR